MFYRELTSQEDKSPITVGRAITRVVAVILSLSFIMSRPALNTLGRNQAGTSIAMSVERSRFHQQSVVGELLIL